MADVRALGEIDARLRDWLNSSAMGRLDYSHLFSLSMTVNICINTSINHPEVKIKLEEFDKILEILRNSPLPLEQTSVIVTQNINSIRVLLRKSYPSHLGPFPKIRIIVGAGPILPSTIEKSNPTESAQPSNREIDTKISFHKSDITDISQNISENRYLHATGPTSIQVNHEFNISARIGIKSEGKNSTPLGRMEIPTEGLPISLRAVIKTSNTLKFLGDDEFEVTVKPRESTEEVQFRFIALARGLATITIRAYIGQTYRGETSLDFDITDINTAPEQNIESSISFRKISHRDITLEIEYNAATSAYRFGLRGPAPIGNNIYRKSLDISPSAFSTPILNQLNELTRNRIKQSVIGINADLQGIGSEIWRRLLPTDLQIKLIECWKDIDRITFLSDEDPIPWELMWCAEKSQFIADAWNLNRWCYGNATSERIGLGSTVYVLPQGAPPAAAKEVQEIQKFYPSAKIWKTVTQLLSGLQNEEIGILHIASHNIIKYNSPLASHITLDENFKQSMLSSIRHDSIKTSPLVFLNACSSAAAVQQWVGSAGWASRFLAIGAGAFIGSLWEIRDNSASKFSMAFYEYAHQGFTLGMAFNKARSEIDKEDPTRLAYTFFGDPDATIEHQEIIP